MRKFWLRFCYYNFWKVLLTDSSDLVLLLQTFAGPRHPPSPWFCTRWHPGDPSLSCKRKLSTAPNCKKTGLGARWPILNKPASICLWMLKKALIGKISPRIRMEKNRGRLATKNVVFDVSLCPCFKGGGRGGHMLPETIMARHCDLEHCGVNPTGPVTNLISMLPFY